MKMNYIKLLNAAFEKFFFDDRLNPTHISLYMALFQEWNSNRFANLFYVNRRELMQVAKIGSKSTYHRCITDLSHWNYLNYFPSNNPYKGSKIKMAIIGTSDEPVTGDYDPMLEQLAEQYSPPNVPVMYQHHPTEEQELYPHRPVTGQALVSNINITKETNIYKQTKARQAVLNFFAEKGFSADEGKKFLEHYQKTNWKTKDEKKVRDWRAVAINWMNRTELNASESKLLRGSQGGDNLKTSKTKNYGEPL